MANTKTKRNYLTHLLYSNRRFMLLYGFILAISAPLGIIFFNSAVNPYSVYKTGKYLLSFIALLAAILIPLSKFKHTTSKKALDVFDSLPIRKEVLFRTHYLEGIIELLLPYVLNWLAALGLVLLTNYSYLSSETSILIELFALLVASIALISTYTIITFIIQNCGTIVDSLISSFIWLILPILAYFTYMTYCVTNIIGYAETISLELSNCFSSVFAIFSNLNINQVLTLSNGYPYIFHLIITLVLFYFASHLYVNHRSENAETPYTNKYFFPITSIAISSVIMILIHLAFSAIGTIPSFYRNYIYPLLIGAALYLIMDVIAHRGFKNIIKASINIVIIESLALIILLPIRYTKGFGYSTRVPDVDKIQEININYYHPLAEYFDFFGYSRNTKYSSVKNIQTIVDFHEQIIDNYDEYNFDQKALKNQVNEDYAYFILTYQLEDKEFVRNYTIPISWFNPLNTLLTSEAHYPNRFPFLYIDTYNTAAISISSSINNLRYIDYYQPVTELNFEELKELLLLDIKNEQEDTFYNTTKVLGNLRIDLSISSNNSPNYFPMATSSYDASEYIYTYEIPLYEHYHNVIGYLEDKGYDFNTLNYPDDMVMYVYEYTEAMYSNHYSYESIYLNPQLADEPILVLSANDEGYQAVGNYFDPRNYLIENKKYIIYCVDDSNDYKDNTRFIVDDSLTPLINELLN